MQRFLLLAAVLASASAITCPSGYNAHFNTCYKVYYNPLTRLQAQYQCQQDGGYLPTITDDDTNMYLFNLARMVGSIFLGLVCTSDNIQACRFDDANKLIPGGYQSFYGNLPFTKMGYCVWMEEGGHYAGEWASVDCMNTTSPFVCQWGNSPACSGDVTTTVAPAQPTYGPYSFPGYCNNGDVLTTPVTISTPNYPNSFIPNFACMWHIHATTTASDIVFTDVDLGDAKIEIYSDNTLQNLIVTIMNNVTLPYTIHDIDYNPSIVFEATDGGIGKGFRAEIRDSESNRPRMLEKRTVKRN